MWVQYPLKNRIQHKLKRINDPSQKKRLETKPKSVGMEIKKIPRTTTQAQTPERPQEEATINF